jgi:hypothetical protein
MSNKIKHFAMKRGVTPPLVAAVTANLNKKYEKFEKIPFSSYLE